jgi:drug/metabolite transporter (DMT)-like permease
MSTPLIFIVTVLLWGTTWYAVALQVGPVPALVSVFYRFGLAALVINLALLATGRHKVPSRRDQPFLVAQALCIFSLNFICFYNAAANIPSGLISVVFSLATIYNSLNARIFFGDRITLRTLVAASLGVAGLILLFGRAALINLDAATLKGVGLSALGTLLFSLGNMASRRNSAAGVSPVVANAWSMAYGALALFALVQATHTPIVAPPDARYLLALLYLAVFGSVVGFTTYLMLVQRLGSSRAAYATVLFPIVALFLSSLFEGYRWTAAGGVGLILCLVGNAVMFAPAPRFWRRPEFVMRIGENQGPAAPP